MKVLFLVVAFYVSVTYGTDPVLIMKKGFNMKDVHDYKKWSIQHGSASDPMKIKTSLSNFLANRKAIEQHNQKPASWKMGFNKFSDMSFEEFSSLYLMESQNCSATRSGHPMSGRELPDHKDWTQEGDYVTPVKNQGACGSCWTFSTTGCLESATAIHKEGHPLYSLSEQQLVDCAQAFDDHGCNGGLPSHAFEYIRYNKGLMSEPEYPYHAKKGPCKFQPSEAIAFVKSVVNITKDSESELEDAVAFHNPVSVAFQVTKDFQQYKSGVYSNPSCSKLASEVNHAVLAVGYGVDKASGMKYWLIKNSWGPDWGINGYFKMQRGVNMCGVATCASYPVVA